MEPVLKGQAAFSMEVASLIESKINLITWNLKRGAGQR